MKFLTGDCVNIFSEIDSSKISGTTITLISLTDPNGNIITLNQAMLFGSDADDTNIASTTYQLDEDCPTGRWEYIVKSANGSRNNYANGYFFVEDK